MKHSRPVFRPPTGERYTAEYRHFDALIWQLPGWSTAIFLVTAGGSRSIQQAVFLQESTGLTAEQLASGLFGLMFLVILVLSQALYRFREHQAALRQHAPAPPWSSSATYLQLIVTAEAFTLLFLVLLMNGVARRPAGWICIAFIVVLSLYREIWLRWGPATRTGPPK